MIGFFLDVIVELGFLGIKDGGCVSFVSFVFVVVWVGVDCEG